MAWKRWDVEMAEYRTTPQDTPNMPSGVPYIVGNELAERFSYYGMRTILVLSGVTTREGIEAFPYRPTFVYEDVGHIPVAELG